MRALVTGSRNWPWPSVVFHELDRVFSDNKNGLLVVLEGGAGGVDSYAADWMKTHPFYNRWIFGERYGAKWYECGPECTPGHRRRRKDGTEYCPMAGHRRNQKMVDAGADICLAFRFAKSSGTTDCMMRAQKAGIEVRLFDVWIGQYVGEPLHKEG